MKEIRKGRLAMLSMFGYYVHAAVTGQCLVENRASHIADSFAVNRLTLEIAAQYAPSPSVAMFAAAWKKTAAAPKVDLTGWYGPARKKWLGPKAADSYVPDYLTGEHPDDYGWDSAGHAADLQTFERLCEAEVLHDRWAMLGTLWCLTPEPLQKHTAIDNCASKGVWFKAGAMIFDSDGLNYILAPVLVRAQFILAVLACQVVVMAAIEAYRVNGGPFGGRDLDVVYPGGK